MQNPVTVRPLASAAEMAAASRVYQRAFGYTPADAAIPPKLLVTLSRYGGLVLGGYLGDELIGFSYAFLARDPASPESPAPEPYLFSQATAVLPEHQNSGVGRLLKLAQREHALAAGTTLIRWTFDPVRARNAHVNFDVLGAGAGTLLPDFYGVDEVGRDAGTTSDRLLVDWWLTAPPRPVPGEPPAGGVPGERLGNWLVIPADWDAFRARVAPEEALRVRLAVRAALTDAFAAGLRADSCVRTGPELSAYHLG